MRPALARRLSGRTAARCQRLASTLPARHLAATILAGVLGTSALAADELTEPPAAAASGPAPNSGLDGAMFLDILAAEMEAERGELGDAFGRMIFNARRARDEGLFQRAVQLALQAKSGEKALAAAKLWRSTIPESFLALRTQVQLLLELDRPSEMIEPLRTLIDREPETDRAAMIASVPRFLSPMADKARSLSVAEQALAPYANAPATRSAVRTALGRLALAAGQQETALNQARSALAEDPTAPGPVLLAMELMPTNNTAETLVQGYLARSDALPTVRLAYARALEQQQRIGEAAAQLRLVVKAQPDHPAAWLSLGANLVDLHEPDEATAALTSFLHLMPASDAGGEASGESGDRAELRNLSELAYQLLAQAAEQRGNTRAANEWLDKIEPSRVDLPTLVRRASLMAHDGHLAEARNLVRNAPARDDPDARTRLLAEAQLLNTARQWKEAYELLLGALRNAPDDTTVMYELAMSAEKLARYDDMEALLRRVITLKPEDQHAHNALGYSLADRNVRLSEALGLVQQAVSLAPHDPFIIDSLGWVEFRLGHNDEALKLLRRSYMSRPHVEVATHLGEVLWAMGQRDEALRVWREGRDREGDNEVLQETLARLKVKL